jgi:hypothetical protein
MLRTVVFFTAGDLVLRKNSLQPLACDLCKQQQQASFVDL